MIYTEEKERSHRFALALRMGIPVFMLCGVALYILLSQSETTINSLIFLSFILFAMAIYFFFFLINQSSYENITEGVTHTFTPEYFFRLYNRRSKRKIATVVMISIDNLIAINEKYGVKNGDDVLREVTKQINQFFNSKQIKKLPLCRYKGGDFIFFFVGKKEEYSPLIELFLAKYQENSVKEIEVRFSAVLLDTKHIKDNDEIITRLYELQYAYKNNATLSDDDEIVPEELEHSVIYALNKQLISVALQPVCCNKTFMYDSSVKLINERGGFIHQNRFIPLLNRIGKMRELQSHVLEIIVKIAAKEQNNYVLNISSAILRNGIFFQFALELLQRYPEAKGRVVIMLDEKEYCPQIKRFKEQIAQYRAVGYKIALDKYGGYHTTMLYLKEFQVDYVRFDSLYTRHIKEEKYQNIIQGLNITAHLCGADTWMNMIEDEQSDKIAQALKINYRQGNYHGKIAVLEDTSLKENG